VLFNTASFNGKGETVKKRTLAQEFFIIPAVFQTRVGLSAEVDLGDKRWTQNNAFCFYESISISSLERRLIMKKFGQVLACVFVVVALIALVGCGVSKEDHEKVVSELNKTKADLDKSTAELNKAKADLTQANSKAAALEKSLNEAKGQSEEKVAAAQKQAGDLQAKVDSLTKENADLESTLDKLKAQLAELQKKVGGAQAPAKNLPAVPAKKP
jgi:chaperonin cofactor prefoldin